jgi:hypothetical protein
VTVPRHRIHAVGACLLIALTAGCQQAQPPAQPTPTRAVTPSAAPASVGPSVPPSAAPRAADAAIAAFLGRVQAGDLAYQATFRGRTRHAVDILTTVGSLDVAGADYRLVVEFTFSRGRGTERVEHRYVGGRAWLRIANGRWSRYKTFLAERSMSPLAAIVDETDIQLLGTERARGDVPERYRVEVPTTFFHPSLIPAGNLTAEAVDRSRLELLIEANGVPVSGSSTITGRGRVSGQLQEVVIEADLAFTRVGGAIVVRAP